MPLIVLKECLESDGKDNRRVHHGDLIEDARKLNLFDASAVSAVGVASATVL